MRLNDRPWPAWHPLTEVKADHLLGLEDYLLARTALADEHAHGVDLFNWASSVVFESASPLLTVRISRLRGATPVGEPIYLRSDEPLAATLELKPEPRRPGQATAPPAREAILDLWVEVNRRAGEAGASKDSLPAKFVLVVEQVMVGPHEPLMPAAVSNEHRLYLGRYRWDAANAAELIHRPLVRRLGALEPHDDAWREWVRPLHASIEALLAQALRSASSGSPASAVLVNALSRLAFEWPAMVIPRLARGLRYVAWLCARQSNSRASEVGASEDLRSLDEFPLDKLSGEALPQELARLLPDAAPVETLATDLPGAVKALLAVLAVADVDYYAPTELLDRWASELRRTRSQARNVGNASALHEEIGGIFRTFETSTTRSVWTRAVMLVTASIVEATTGQPFPRVDLSWSGRGSLASESARLLGDLLQDGGSSKRAGPIAFYFLARAAAELPEISTAAANGLAEYFVALNRTPAARQQPHRGTSTAQTRTSSRAAGYLEQAVNSGSPAVSDVKAVSWRREDADRRPRRMSVKPPESLKIVIAGPAESGKTTLLRHICDASTGVGGRSLETIRVDSTNELPGLTRVIGSLGSADGSTGLTIEDVSGSEFNRAIRSGSVDGDSVLGKTLRDCDLLVMTLAPSDVAEGPGGAVIARATSVAEWVRSRPGAMVAIAYTKADQYGVVNPLVLRFVDADRSAVFRDYVATKDAKAWTRFVGASSTTTEKRHQHGGGTITGGTIVTRVDDLSPTRAWILERTRSIWDGALGPNGSGLLNGYFIAASPFDSRLNPVEHRGMFQLFADLRAQRPIV